MTTYTTRGQWQWTAKDGAIYVDTRAEALDIAERTGGVVTETTPARIWRVSAPTRRTPKED